MLKNLVNKAGYYLQGEEKVLEHKPDFYQPEAEVSVAAKNVSAAYNRGETVLKDINLEIQAGQLTSIIGPNGAGKSTFFYLLAGIMSPLSGRIWIFGDTVEEQKRNNNIAYVPQEEDIDWDFPIRVRDVILGGRYGHMKSASGWRRFLPPCWAGKEHQEIVENALEAVDMEDYHRRPIGELSGGQKKRVFLARALAQKAGLLLLDEPLVGVDRESEELILGLLGKMKRQGHSIIMISHDLNRIKHHADRVIYLNETVITTGSAREVLESSELSRV
ncbi:MAG: metal ABC transporter ATP-binding protein [Halanaerobiales bacterium]